MGETWQGSSQGRPQRDGLMSERMGSPECSCPNSPAMPLTSTPRCTWVPRLCARAQCRLGACVHRACSALPLQERCWVFSLLPGTPIHTTQSPAFPAE